MKKILSIILTFAMIISLCACGSKTEISNPQDLAESTINKVEEQIDDQSSPQAEIDESEETADINLYVLSGPTGIGALNLWNKAETGETKNNYTVTMPGENTEIVAAISKGEADIACIATNLASTLYNKTEGNVTVLAVNTLGVLSILSNSQDTVSSIADLKGHTIYSPGQGANPEYILRYILSGNNLDPDTDVSINFVSEGSELLNVWVSDPDAYILAPQPVATTLLMKNESATKAFDVTNEWNNIANGESTLMMGCVIVRNDFLEEHKGAVNTFLKEYEESIIAASSDIEGTAQLCEKYGIIPKASLAQKALPECGLCFVSGEEMKSQLSGYLQVMFDAQPNSIGGKLPAESFYYENK